MDLFEDSEVICKRTIKQIEPPELLTDPEWVANQYESHYKRLSAEERPTLLKVIALHQSRVETREGVPVQLFPFTRAPALDTPRFVVIDPEIRFGRPTVKGVPTDVLMERWHAGDPVANLAEDYNVPTEEIEEALRYESSSFSPFGFFPFEPLRFPW